MVEYDVLMTFNLFGFYSKTGSGKISLNPASFSISYKNSLDLLIAILFYSVAIEALYIGAKVSEYYFSPLFPENLKFLSYILIISIIALSILYLYVKRFMRGTSFSIPYSEITDVFPFDVGASDAESKPLKGISTVLSGKPFKRKINFIPVEKDAMGQFVSRFDAVFNALSRKSD